MKTIQREGKSTSIIIANFMKEFEYKLEDFKFDVIDEGSSGFLHLFGGKPAKIRFTVPDTADYLEDYVSHLLRLMAIEFEKVEVETKGDLFYVSIKEVEDAGFVIGKSAKLLDSLQYLVNQMINKKLRQKIRLKLDVNDYRERSDNQFMKRIGKVTEQVKKNGKSTTLEPLPASQRRMVHQIIEKEKQLRTMTIGEGSSKRIVIIPQNENPAPVKKKRPRKKPIKKELTNEKE
jgi:spoIIIJ-associated protein